MSHLWARAEFRDRIRRDLGIVPPIDVSGSMAIPGQQPTNYPSPTNQQINQALQDFISRANIESGFHVTGFNVPVVAISGNVRGPFGLYLGDVTPNSSGSTTLLNPKGLFNDVKRVTWTPSGGGVPRLLQPAWRDSIDRGQNNDYYAQPPAEPQIWWIEGYVLNVSPAQSSDGVYNLICGSGIIGLQCDDDVLDQVPIDYQHIFVQGAIWYLSITQTMDVEAQSRVQAFQPLALQGVQDMRRFVLGGTGAPAPQMTFASYRSGYGTRRIVR